MASFTKHLKDRKRRRAIELWLRDVHAYRATGDSSVSADSQQFGSSETPECKMQRLTQWAADDRCAQAMMELHDWQSSPHCPVDATALLLGLLIQQDRKNEAQEILTHALQRTSASHGAHDVSLLRYRIAMATLSRDTKREQLIESLHRQQGHEPQVMRWLHLMQGSNITRLPNVSEATINQLAGELLDHLDAIPSLVAAQRLAPDAQTIAMLRGAMVQMLRDVDEERSLLLLCQAMADLAMLADDGEDARRWAHRGLRIDPYAAPLAIILSKLQDDPAIGPTASSVLKAAVNAHPKYPDLRAALIRREASEGRVEVARRRLHQWLQREPNQIMALRLQQELAA